VAFKKDVKMNGKTPESIALSFAIICRLQNPKVLQYGISTVLFQSGAKHKDL